MRIPISDSDLGIVHHYHSGYTFTCVDHSPSSIGEKLRVMTWVEFKRLYPYYTYKINVRYKNKSKGPRRWRN